MDSVLKHVVWLVKVESGRMQHGLTSQVLLIKLVLRGAATPLFLLFVVLSEDLESSIEQAQLQIERRTLYVLKLYLTSLLVIFLILDYRL